MRIGSARKRRGAVLILVLIVLSAVTAVLASSLATERTEFQAAATRISKEKARAVALAGVQYAVANLVLQSASQTTQQDTWFSLGTEGNEKFVVGNGSFRLQILDAASLVNLNTASEAQLQNLGLTQEQIDSLLDWREASETPRTEGAKDEYYNQLTNPYNAKLRRLDSLDELFLVKGFDVQSIYQAPAQSTTVGNTILPLYQMATVDSFSTNSTSAGGVKTNINVATAQQLTQRGIQAVLAAAIIARRPAAGFATMGAVLASPGMTSQAAGIIIDGFQLGGAPRSEGKINVNTASADILATIPGLTVDIAQAIVSRQTAGIQNLSELLQVPGITVQVMQQIVDSLTTASETFIALVEGTSGTTRLPIEAIISINGGRVKVIKLLDPPYENMTTIWGWQDETTTETVLVESA